MFRSAIVGVALFAALSVAAVGAGHASAQPAIDGKAVVCDTFDQYGVNRQSLKWIGDFLKDRHGETPKSAAAITQLAVNHFCPQHQGALSDLGRQLERDQHPDNPLFN